MKTKDFSDIARKKLGILPTHYSGGRSTKFWNRVNKINDPELRIYQLGCVLQSLESFVLNELARQEKQKK